MITIPRRFQPHGLFLAVDPDTFAITHVSDTSEALIGARPASLLGQPLTRIFSANQLARIGRVLSGDLPNPMVATIAGRRFDVASRHLGAHLYIDLEPRISPDERALTMIRDVVRSMTEAPNSAELWNRAARGMRKITGYDRVNIARFHPDGHGEVVGAAQADRLESHLGLHFPVANIPDEPSRLYATKRSRLIVDSRAEPAAMWVDADHPAADDLEVAAAMLAAPSPRDLGLIQRLGHVSTFSISLVRGDELAGVITCAHRRERRLSYSLREGLEIIADQLTLQSGAMEELLRLEQREAMRQTRERLAAQVAAGNDVIDAVLRGERTALDLVAADAAVVRLGDRIEGIGDLADPDFLARVPGIVEQTGAPGDFSCAAIPLDFPDLAVSMPGVAGMLLRRLGGADDFIAWFRRETTYTIEWIDDLTAQDGGQEEPVGGPVQRKPGRPSDAPRTTREVGSGTCAPWDVVETETTELSRVLETALLDHARAQLADLALLDPLTGLLNRRALIETLEQRLAKPAAGSLALLFVDIDEFKGINDRFGHAAGDAALVHASQRLRSVAREGDIVARLGGDEFVVVIDRLDESEADRVAARLVDAIREPPADGSPWRVQASVGIAFAEPEDGASAVLGAADAAMFRAKLGGRNRASR